MRVKILASASRDLVDGAGFYNRQEQGLGGYFLDSLFSDIDCLQLYGGIHPRHFGTFHRMLSKRFPFAVYYELDQDTAIVYAVLDSRRDPAWIRDQLGSRANKPHAPTAPHGG